MQALRTQHRAREAPGNQTEAAKDKVVMTREIKYRCNLCRDEMGCGYGINWTGTGGGNKLNLVNDTHAAKQLENHICTRCVNQIESECEREGTEKSVIFG
jgi:hypothetical protein